ncbi:MAG TPA: RHS repeat-associated core domain-containing protein [Candidatus Cloacimonadota bacterium]|nr:RHS repeat-associated core domain-containing protein [Candidatus Cloacimonadota bacterium]
MGEPNEQHGFGRKPIPLEYDDETGLHNFRARLYDRTLMRVYQVDPAEQFASPYVYCG